MKRIPTFLMAGCIVLTSVQLNAQTQRVPSAQDSKYILGGSIGYSKLYGDWSGTNRQPVFKINAARILNKRFNINMDVTRGILNNYEPKRTWNSGISMNNKFTSVSVSGSLVIGELINWPHSLLGKTFRGIYIGAGGGYMWNSITSPGFAFTNPFTNRITNFEGITQRSKNFNIPGDLGADVCVTPRVAINVNYQLCYAFSDYVNGYRFPAPTATNDYNDMYSTLTFGVRFHVGSTNATKQSLTKM